jgi:hypothetical protein
MLASKKPVISFIPSIKQLLPFRKATSGKVLGNEATSLVFKPNCLSCPAFVVNPTEKREQLQYKVEIERKNLAYYKPLRIATSAFRVTEC